MSSWGILGTGHIARKFAQSLAGTAGERLAAVASRDEGRAAAFAAASGAARAYGDYAALLADPEVRCVYIALPNSMHAEWALAGARAGKHMLCEKPLGLSAAEAAAMFAAAREHQVWLMEGFMYRFHPQTLKVQELLAAGAVGRVELIQVAFGVTIGDRANIRHDPALGGGALLDLGCYCVNIARLAAGRAPARATAVGRFSPAGVDELIVATLEYPGGAVAQISCGMGLSRHQAVRIVGDAGSIELETCFSIPADEPLTIRLRRGSTRPELELISIPPADHFQLEAAGFSRLIAAGHGAHGLAEMPPIESLENAATIDAILRSAREGRPIDL